MEVVEVFKTNVDEIEQAKLLVKELLLHFPHCKINFDLEDCDKILRVQGMHICIDKIIQVVHTNGFNCQLLE